MQKNSGSCPDGAGVVPGAGRRSYVMLDLLGTSNNGAPP
jgi:hypothetical protein